MTGMMRFLFGFTVARATRVCSDQRHGEKNMEKKKKNTEKAVVRSGNV